MPRNREPTDRPGEIHCYDCGQNYDYLGAGSHPGVCAGCGSAAVSLAGDVEVRAVYDDQLADGKIVSIDIVVVDETQRAITYTASACDGLAVMELVVLGAARIKAGTEPWRCELVPDAVVDALEDEGYTYVVSTDRSGAGDGTLGGEGR